MRASLSLFLFSAVVLVGCGGPSQVGPTTPQTSPQPAAGPRLAGTVPIPPGNDAFGPAFARDGASVAFAAGGQLYRFEPATLAKIDARPIKTVPKLSGTAIVLHGVQQGDAAIDLADATRVVIAVPAGYDCGEASFSADAARLSRNCSTKDEENFVFVQDARTGATIAELRELVTAAPVRAGEITDSGNFVFWTSRASGAFEEIKSKVIGPTMSSHSAMSPDERFVFTVSDKGWMPDDRTPAQMIDPKNGQTRYTLPFDIDRVHFSPDSRRFAAVHLNEERHVTAVTLHRTDDGAVLGQLGDREVELIVFSPDAKELLVRGGGVLKLYVGIP
jgi:hypothetical protein